MKGDGGIDGSSSWWLCDILCDEGCERESAWRQILPRRADSSFTMSGESSSSSSSSSTLGGHWMSLTDLMPSLSHIVHQLLTADTNESHPHSVLGNCAHIRVSICGGI